MSNGVVQAETTSKVLSCDTITQTKDKALDALYPNISYTSRPTAQEVRLCTFAQYTFYARQHVMLSASLLRQRRPSACPSVTLLYCVKTTQLRIMKSSLWDSPASVVSNEVILVPLGEEMPLERGHQRGEPV